MGKRQVTVITGMRRVGKSTAIKYLLEHAGQPDYEGIKANLELRGLDFSRPCLIAIDEIQLVSGLPGLIKYLFDTYQTKFIVTGSSSCYMKDNFSESLAGRKRIFEMHPLIFRQAKNFLNS